MNFRSEKVLITHPYTFPSDFPRQHLFNYPLYNKKFADACNQIKLSFRKHLSRRKLISHGFSMKAITWVQCKANESTNWNNVFLMGACMRGSIFPADIAWHRCVRYTWWWSFMWKSFLFFIRFFILDDENARKMPLLKRIAGESTERNWAIWGCRYFLSQMTILGWCALFQPSLIMAVFLLRMKHFKMSSG